MENKTTTELLNLLANLKDDDYKEDGKYQQIMGELETREPFMGILGKDWDTSLPAVWEAIKEIQETLKLLKRHKHDEKTDDVMVRI